ncbi:MAG: ABC transporter ATP-binding protein [Planctomycetota bacterium]
MPQQDARDATMIEAHALSKAYAGVPAVREVAFALTPGRTTALLGPNGAGKTTTIRMITGTLAPDRGHVTINGTRLDRDPLAARAGLGYMPESCPVYPEMTPPGYLRFRAGLQGLRGRDARAAVERAIDRCRLSGVRHKRVGTLSKGYRQRVGLAAAILHDPRVLILDEPTNGLDPSQIVESRSLIGELAADRTVLLCTHILQEVERACDRVLILVAGRLCADGSPAELAAGAGGGAALTAELRASEAARAAELIRTITGVRGVASTSIDNAWCTVAIAAEPNAGDLREPVARTLAVAQIVPRELAPVRRSLESVFVELATGGAS